MQKNRTKGFCMSMLKSSALAALAVISFAAPACASVMEFYIGDALVGSCLETFDELALGSSNGTYGLTGITSSLILSNAAQIYQGTSGNAATPYLDTSKYVGIGTNGLATFTFAQPTNYFAMQWGSVDSYNTLTFYNGATEIGTFNGQQIINAASLIAGNQSSHGTQFVNFISTEFFTRAVASSSGVAYEFDNIRIGLSNAPLPGALPMFAAVIGMGAYVASRRRKAHAA